MTENFGVSDVDYIDISQILLPLVNVAGCFFIRDVLPERMIYLRTDPDNE